MHPVLDIQGSRAVAVWTRRVQRSAKDHVKVMRRWLAFVDASGGDLAGLGPDGLVEYQLAHHDFAVLDLVQVWVGGLDVRLGTKQRYYNALRSFFLHNRAELPRDPSFRLESRRTSVRGALSIEEVKRAVEVCSPMYRAVFTCMVMGGMGFGEILHWSHTGYTSLLSQLRDRRRFIRVDLPGRKQGRNLRPFYTLLGGDAIDALNLYLTVRPNVGEDIFYTRDGGALIYETVRSYWIRHLKKLAIVKPGSYGTKGSVRYGKSPHELRDVFRTRWHKSGADALAAEFMMGHLVDPLGYNKAMDDQAYVEAQYIVAEPYLNILTMDPEKVPKSEMEARVRESERRMAQQMEQQERRIAAMEKYMEKHKDNGTV